MDESQVTFFKNDQKLCQACGISAPVRPFVSIGSRDVVITIKSCDASSYSDLKTAQFSTPMLEVAVRAGLDLVEFDRTCLPW